MDTNTHFTLNLKYRQTTAGLYNFEDIERGLANPNHTFCFSRLSGKQLDHQYIGLLTTGDRIINKATGEHLKNGFYWCINSFNGDLYRKDPTLFLNKVGCGASSISLIQGFTIENDNGTIEEQINELINFVNVTGLMPYCITISGETNKDIVESFLLGAVPEKERSVYLEMLKTFSLRKGKSLHVTFLLETIYHPTEAQSLKYKSILEKAIILYGGDLATANKDRLMRAPGTIFADQDKKELIVQPVLHLDINAPRYTRDEVEAKIDSYISKRYPNLNMKNAVDDLRLYSDLISYKRYNVRLFDPNNVLMDVLNDFKRTKEFSSYHREVLRNIRATSQLTSSNTVVECLEDFEKANPKMQSVLNKKSKSNLNTRTIKSKKGKNIQFCSSETLVNIPKEGAKSFKEMIASGRSEVRCHCPFHGWTNAHSTNASFYNKNGKASLTCFTGCGTFFVNDDQCPVSIVSDLSDFNEEDLFSNCVFYETYDYNTTKLYPFKPLTKKLTILNGPCGVGKTYMGVSLVEDFLKRNLNSLALHITYRVTLTYQAEQNYLDRGILFSHYKKDKDGINKNMVYCIDSLLKYNSIQMEEIEKDVYSFKKEKGKLLITLDEYTQCLNALFERGDKLSAAKAQRIMQRLADWGRDPNVQFLLLDADHDKYTLDMLILLLDIQPNEIEIRGFKNYVQKYKYRLMPTSQDVDKEIEEALANGKTCAIACSDRSKSEILYKTLSEKFPNEMFVLVNQQTKEELAQNGYDLSVLDQPNVQWIKPVAGFIYSPTLQAGVSIVHPIDKCFFYGSRGHSRNTDIIQMTNRFRNINDKTIIGHIEDGGATKSINANNIINNHNFIKNKEKGLFDNINVYLSEEELKDIKDLTFEHEESTLFRDLWVRNLVRNRMLGGDCCKLKAAFLDLCQERGIDVIVDDPTTSIFFTDTDRCISISKKNKEAKKEIKERQINDILNATDISFSEAKNIKEPKNNDESNSKTKAFIKHFFDKETLDKHLVETYVNRKGQLTNLRNVVLCLNKQYYKLAKDDLASSTFGEGRDAKFQLVQTNLYLNMAHKMGKLDEVTQTITQLMAWMDAEEGTLEHNALTSLSKKRAFFDSAKINQTHTWLKSDQMKPYDELGFWIAPKAKEKTMLVKDKETGSVNQITKEVKERPLSKINDLFNRFGLSVGCGVYDTPTLTSLSIEEEVKVGKEKRYWIDNEQLLADLRLIRADLKRYTEATPTKASQDKVEIEAIDDNWLEQAFAEAFGPSLRSLEGENDIDEDNDDIRFAIYDMINSDDYVEDDEE